MTKINVRIAVWEEGKSEIHRNFTYEESRTDFNGVVEDMIDTITGDAVNDNLNNR